MLLADIYQKIKGVFMGKKKTKMVNFKLRDQKMVPNSKIDEMVELGYKSWKDLKSNQKDKFKRRMI